MCVWGIMATWVVSGEHSLCTACAAACRAHTVQGPPSAASSSPAAAASRQAPGRFAGFEAHSLTAGSRMRAR